MLMSQSNLHAWRLIDWKHKAPKVSPVKRRLPDNRQVQPRPQSRILPSYALPAVQLRSVQHERSSFANQKAARDSLPSFGWLAAGDLQMAGEVQCSVTQKVSAESCRTSADVQAEVKWPQQADASTPVRGRTGCTSVSRCGVLDQLTVSGRQRGDMQKIRKGVNFGFGPLYLLPGRAFLRLQPCPWRFCVVRLAGKLSDQSEPDESKQKISRTPLSDHRLQAWPKALPTDRLSG